MTDLLHSLLISPLVNRLGWTLLHSLWQLAAIALLAALLLQLAAHRSAAARYLLAAAAYTLMPLALIITFLALAPETPATSPAPTAVSVTTPTALPSLHLAPPANSPAFPTPVTPQLPASPSIPPAVPIAHRLTPLLPPIAVTLWLLGILLLSLRNLGAWIALLRLRALSIPAPLLLQNRLASLATRLRLSRPIPLATSTLISTPMALGTLRPLILIPAATLLQLPPDHLEAILAHELAHIRRHDYLLNLLQTLLDTLLFYHPAAWWLSRHIRTERELACDDLAAATCGDPTRYAHALLSLEESRAPQFALAATTPNLLHRIHRLIAPPTPTRPIPLTAILLTLLAITLPLLLPLAHAQPAPPLPAAQSPSPVPADRIKIQVLDAALNPVPITDIYGVTATLTADSITEDWPKVLDRFPGQAILVDRQHFPIGHADSLLTLRFKSSNDLPQIARAFSPGGKPASLTLNLATVIDRGFSLSSASITVPPGSIGGRILDSAGHPLAGATISVPDHSLPLTLAKVKTLLTTAADGAFTISAPRFLLQVDAPGYARKWLYTGDIPQGRPIDVHLDNTTHLQLDLKRPDGSPAAGATLAAATTLPRISDDWTDENLFQLTTADGAGHIDIPLAARTWELRLTDHDKLFARLKNVTLPPGNAAARTITLTPGVHTTIRVVDFDTGDPIPGVNLAFVDSSPGVSVNRAGSQRTTGKDGIADWPNVMPGNAAIGYDAPGYINHYCDDELVKDVPSQWIVYFNLTPNMRQITLRLQKSMRVTGQILDATGQPAPNRVVSIGGLRPADRSATRSDSRGYFELTIPLEDYAADATFTADISRNSPNEKPLASSDPFTSRDISNKILHITLPASPPAPATTGQLLSPSNTPVANATVLLLGPPAPNQPLLASTTTSPTGQFSLPAPATSDPTQLFAALPNVGFTPPIPAPYDNPLTLHLAPAIDVQISLQLPDGSPAANIPVRPTFIIFPTPQGPIGPLVSLPDSLSQKLAVTTDAAGHALFHGLPATATVRFDIDDPRFAHIAPVSQAPLQGDPALIRITLPKLVPASSISGRLLNPETHQPLPGITLLAQDANPTGSSGAATTDAHGNFTITRLLPGSYTLSLNEPDNQSLDFVAPALTITLTASQHATADLHLSRGALVRGQVLDEQTGQPVPGVPIGAYGSARPRRAGPVYRRVSDAQGRFQFRLPPGEQNLFLQAIPEDYLPLPRQAAKTLTVTEGQTSDITFDLPADPAPLVEGTILGPDNKPVPGATVTAGGRKFATAGKDGKFHLHANPGALLHVAANGLNTVDPITVLQDKPLTIHLQKNATFDLSVKIVDESLHPVPTASLVLTTTLGNHATSSAPHPADPAATVHIDKLPLDGAYIVEAQAPGFGVSSQQIHQLPSGTPYDTTIVLHPRTAQIAGTVVDSVGNPAPNITVAMNGAATGAAETKTDATGHFSFPVPEKSSALISLPSVHVTPGTSHKSNAGDTDVHLTYPAAVTPPAPQPATQP
ncbi:MAG TPA: carboxypeptidase regulatory-like domain-containing protein [Phycisphaerae bacterium]|nr:carboxypeptidase regulatory-like domain-containing protein [Phycisphaerae bacterium]